eukprot:scaffold10084_cov139-Isochrysis_galbana.AAC.9
MRRSQSNPKKRSRIEKTQLNMPVTPDLRRNERQISDEKNAKSQSIRTDPPPPPAHAATHPPHQLSLEGQMSGAGPSCVEGGTAESPWLLDRQTVENSPSHAWLVQKCQSDVKAARRKEDEYRKLTCAFIQDTGRSLRLCDYPAAHAQSAVARTRSCCD